MNSIEHELNKIRLPKMYMRNGKKCFLDPYRKKLIEKTPEEVVRQKMARYCERCLGVPAAMLSIEEPMCRYLEDERGRADIIVSKLNKRGIKHPLAVIECKNTDVFLSAKVEDQVAEYCDITYADYFIVTNGILAEAAKYNSRKNEYSTLKYIPSYKEMLNGKGVLLPKPKPIHRFSLLQLRNQRVLKNYNDKKSWIYGSETPKDMRPYIVNLHQAFMDDRHKLKPKKFKNFKVIKDLGTREMDYSNAGAGHFFGEYRSVLVEDRHGDSQIISFRLFGTTERTILDADNLRRKSITSLVVAIDKFKISKSVLEYCVDKYLEIGKWATFLHDGRISSIPSAELRNFVLKKAELITSYQGNLFLGRTPTDRLLYLSKVSEGKLVYTLIEYALLREEFRRKYLKEQKIAKMNAGDKK